MLRWTYVAVLIPLLLCGCELLLIDSPPPPQSPFQAPPQTTDAVPQRSEAPDGSGGWPDAPATQRNPNQFPAISANLAIGNATGQTLVVRVRTLHKGVQFDCATVAQAPSQWLSRNLFAPAQVWQVASSRAFAPAAPASSGCTALLVDGPGLPMRLLFWRNTDYPPTSMPSTVQGGLPNRLIAIQAAAEGLQFSPHDAVLAPPPLQPEAAPKGCATGSPADAVVWSKPEPSGEQTVVELVSAPNGCHFLQLLDKTGIHGWTLCLPAGAMPFEAGDDFFASPLQGGHNLGSIAGLDLLGSAGKRLRVGHGQDVVYFGKGSAKVETQSWCGVAHDGCGSALLPLAVAVTQEGQGSLLSAGMSLPVGAGKLYLARAFDSPVSNPGCGVASAARWIESVYAEGGQP